MTSRARNDDPLARLSELAIDSGDFEGGVASDEDAPSEAAGVDREAATQAVNALGSAWSTFRLYPNPADQPGFGQAMANLSAAVGDGLSIAVGAGTLTVDGHDVDATRGSVEQLATRLFIHDVERVSLITEPDPDELLKLFGLLILDRGGAAQMGGLSRLGEGFLSLNIALRGILSDDSEDQEGADHLEGLNRPTRSTELARMIDEGARADEVHSRLLELAGGDDNKVRAQFVAAFREVHAGVMSSTSAASLADMLLPYTVDDMGPSATGTFIEVYFRLGPQTRGEILEAFLISTMEDESRMFLDQFSGDELAELVPSISEDGYSALIEYARATTESSGDDGELLALLRSAREVRDFRVSSGTRIRTLLAQLEEPLPTDFAQPIREQLDPAHRHRFGAEVIRNLFATVSDARRFNRLADMWAGRVRSHLHERDFAGAIDMLETVLDDPPFSTERIGVLENALARLVTADLTEEAARATGRSEREAVLTFMRAIGAPAVRRVMERLANEEDAARRRLLIELLAELATENPTPLLASLADERWYVVRNVVAVLAKTGLPEAAEPMRRAAEHADARVRVEAIRGLVRLDNREAVPSVLRALGDRSDRVRSTAVTLLRSLSTGTFEVKLKDLLAAGALPDDALAGIASHLAQHVPGARADLQEIASRRFTLKRSERAARAAARAALGVTSG